MKYHIILFDADMTLFDFEKAEALALQRTLQAHGYPSDFDTCQAYRQINESLWRAFERQEVTKEELLAQRFTRFFKAVGIDGDGAAFNQEYLYALGDGAFLLPGALELCQNLYGRCRMYIVTNGVTQTQRRRLAASPLKGYMDGIFVSEETGFQKPRKEFFDYVFGSIALADLKRVIIVGDSLTSDIQGGINAGIDSCWYNPKGLPNYGGIPCTYEIARLCQLEEIIK